MPDDESPDRRRVRRGEGEVTSWPRGLVDYVPSGPKDETPGPEEDRTRNRLNLAARLIGVLRAAGEPVDGELAELEAAQQALDGRDPTDAARRIDRLLARLDARTTSRGAGRTTP